MKLLLAALVVLFSPLAYAVDRGNFKTCQDSSFCKLHRAMQPTPESDYEVLPKSMIINATLTTFELFNSRTRVRFYLHVYAYSGATLRFKIEEVETSIHQRFEIPLGDVITHEPPAQQLVPVAQTDEFVVLQSPAGYAMKVQYKPFHLTIAHGSMQLLAINAAGLLKFQHYRRRGDATNGKSKGVLSRLSSWFSSEVTTTQAGEGEANQADLAAAEASTREQSSLNNEPDEVWEENFKSHEDRKPYGPSSVGVDISFVGFQHMYGLPEHANSFRLKSTMQGNSDPHRLYNLDVFEYELENPMSLYGAIPLVIAHKSEWTMGVLWLNPSETWVDTDYRSQSAFTHFMSESGNIDIYVFLGRRPRDVMAQYGNLVGVTPLPPLFSLGYHQCRWNYNDQADVAGLNEAFDEHKVPCDVIWLDIEHTNGKQYFTWDQHKFSDPVGMQRNLSAKGRRLVTIVDPHQKRDSSYSKYVDVQSHNWHVRDRDGREFDGWCWPGSSSWPDFSIPAVREWWADQFQLNNYPGSTEDLYIWNDMNEPSVFNGPEITMHKDALHLEGTVEHREIHNLYGHYQVMGTFAGLLRRSSGQRRPFILTRSFFAGTQRYAAVWTGDNIAEWSHLKITTAMLLQLSMSGITFCGSDVGGFFRNPDSELLTRWYQAATFHPFYREHSHIETRRREPWVWDPTTLNNIRRAIHLRYSYLPYWYTLFYETERTSIPPMRPLWFEFPADSQTFDQSGIGGEISFMVGPALLVHPVVAQGQQSVEVYLPRGLWYRADDWSIIKSGDGGIVSEKVSLATGIPVYQRGGTVIPRWLRSRRASPSMQRDPITLIVCLDGSGSATGTLYVDDFDGYAYRRGAFTYRRFDFTNNTLTSRSAVSPNQPTVPGWSTPIWIERVIIAGVTSDVAPTQVVMDSQTDLQFGWDQSHGLLVVRRPGISVGNDFEIKLMYK